MVKDQSTAPPPSSGQKKSNFLVKLSAELGGVAVAVMIINAVLGGVIGEATGEVWSASKEWLRIGPTPDPLLTPPVSNSTGAQRTDVRFARIFNEANGELLPHFEEISRSPGHCIGGLASADPLALRCFSDSPDSRTSFVSDPCWRNGWGDEVACPSNPWASKVRVIEDARIEHRAYTETPNPKFRPWAIELNDPDDPNYVLRCVFQAGSGMTELDGKRLNYGCRDKDSKVTDDRGYSLTEAIGFAYGDPVQNEDELWTIYYSARENPEGKVTTVRAVWR